MYVAHGALHQSLGSDTTVLCPQLLFQRAAVDADANGNGFPAAQVRHHFHPLLSADIAGVDTDSVHAPLRTGNRVLIIEMDICHQGNMDTLFQLVHYLCCRLVRNGYPDDLTPSGLQIQNLSHSGLHIIGLRIAHGLDRHRCAAAHRNAAHQQLFRHDYPPFLSRA